MPSEDFMASCREFDMCFQRFHNKCKNHIDQEEDVISRMTMVLAQEFPSWPMPILQLFAKTRTFIRMKFVNHDLKVQRKTKKLEANGTVYVLIVSICSYVHKPKVPKKNYLKSPLCVPGDVPHS